MHLKTWTSRRARAAAVGAVALLVALQAPLGAFASTLVQLSVDPYTNTTSQHRTQVEPDTYAFGSTIVAAIQTGRFFDGGASNIAWATSQDGGATWQHGYLPGTTVYATPAGPFARISDPSVAYDPKHNVWLIAALPLNASVTGIGVSVNRSTDGGLTWTNPVMVASQNNTDKDWIACDTTASSPFYGNCYVEWDLPGRGNLVQMSTSTDGGQTWSTPQSSANNATVIGGQPLVQPNGTVVVPIDNAFEGSVIAFRSTNGGATWSSTTQVASISSRADPGGIRSGPLPTAEIDASGKIYVVWEDCRFESGCSANDLVMTTSTDGVNWSAVQRIPLDPIGSGVDHFLPGLAIDHTTSGSSAHLGLVYYYYPTTNCTVSTCQLDVATASSTNGGATWSAPTQVGGPMSLSWVANTSQGRMVGDYMSASFVGGKAYPAISGARPINGSTFRQSLFTVGGGFALTGGTLSAAGDVPVYSGFGDRTAPVAPLTAN